MSLSAVKQPSLTGSPLDSSEIATASMSDDQKKQSLFDAAKEGEDQSNLISYCSL